MTVETLVTIIVAVAAAAPGLYAVIAQRRVTAATAADTITGSAVSLVQQYKAQVDAVSMELEMHQQLLAKQQSEMAELRDELTTLRTRVREYRMGVQILTEQVSKLGQEPRYRLPDADTAKEG